MYFILKVSETNMNILKWKRTSGRIHRFIFDSLKNDKNEPSYGASNRFSGNNEDVRDDKEEDSIISREILKILLRVFAVYRNVIDSTFHISKQIINLNEL